MPTLDGVIGELSVGYFNCRENFILYVSSTYFFYCVLLRLCTSRNLITFAKVSFPYGENLSSTFGDSELIYT